MTHTRRRKVRHARAVDKIAKLFDQLTKAMVEVAPLTLESEVRQLKTVGYRVVNKAREQATGRGVIGV